MSPKPLNTAALLLLSLMPLAAQEKTNSIPLSEFRAFDVVVKRNIFDANRRAGRSDGSRQRDNGPRTRIESFSLLGTIGYEKGLFAFFGGSSSQYRKVLGPDDLIAGYHIKEIEYDHVCLAVSNEPPVELKVGARMKREEDGPWTVAGFTPVETSISATSTTSTDSASSAPTGSSDAENEILKRLMKKREQELSK